MPSVPPDQLVTVRTTFQPSVDLQVSVSEAESLRRRGLLVPDEEEPQTAQVAATPAPPKSSARRAADTATS